MTRKTSTLAEVSIEALNSALVLRKALDGTRCGFAQEDGRLFAYLGSVFDIEDAGKSAACDKLLYAADVALHALIDVAGNLNCMGGNPIPGAIELSAAPCGALGPMVSGREDLCLLAHAIEDSETLSLGVDLFMRGGDSIEG